jgi:hypothetical protein
MGCAPPVQGAVMDQTSSRFVPPGGPQKEHPAAAGAETVSLRGTQPTHRSSQGNAPEVELRESAGGGAQGKRRSWSSRASGAPPLSPGAASVRLPFSENPPPTL